MRESSRGYSGPDWTQHLLTVLGGLAAVGGVVKFFGTSADEKVALYYLLTGGALLVLREVKTLSFGDWKLELQARVAAIKDELQRESPVNTMGPRTRPRTASGAISARSVDVEMEPAADAAHDDPHKGQFGNISRSNGLVLEAELKPVGDDSGFVDVQLVVRSENEPHSTLTGAVDFHLHPSFPYPERRVAVRNGRAVLNLRAYGAFTVGAVTDSGKTKLELDLATVRGATRKFYES